MELWIVKKKLNSTKIQEISLDKTVGVDFTPKKNLKDAISVHEMVLYDPLMIEVVILKKVRKKYDHLLKLLSSLLNSDDDTGTALREALNLIEKFRQEIVTKYVYYLKEKELEEMGKHLAYLQKDTKMRLLGIGQYQNIFEQTNHRAR